MFKTDTVMTAITFLPVEHLHFFLS